VSRQTTTARIAVPIATIAHAPSVPVAAIPSVMIRSTCAIRSPSHVSARSISPGSSATYGGRDSRSSARERSSGAS
jgi:hypothetical protein